MQEGVKKCCFFPAYSVIDLSVISTASLGKWRSWNCTLTPLTSASSMKLRLLEGRVSHGHSWSQSILGQLTIAGMLPAHAHMMALMGQKHRTICREGNRERKESQGNLRPSKRGRQWPVVQHQPGHSWGSKPNLAANKPCQQPWANRFCSFSLVQTWHFGSFLPLSPCLYQLLSLTTADDKAGTGTGWHADGQKVHIQLLMVTETQSLSFEIYSSLFNMQHNTSERAGRIGDLDLSLQGNFKGWFLIKTERDVQKG